jgi:hypothetical protein
MVEDAVYDWQETEKWQQTWNNRTTNFKALKKTLYKYFNIIYSQQV